jgi:hypothetical protein
MLEFYSLFIPNNILRYCYILQKYCINVIPQIRKDQILSESSIVNVWLHCTVPLHVLLSYKA